MNKGVHLYHTGKVCTTIPDTQDNDTDPFCVLILTLFFMCFGYVQLCDKDDYT